MKRFFTAVAAIAALSFVGCVYDGLTGTTWECATTYSEYDSESETLKFESFGKVKYIITEFEEGEAADTKEIYGTYSFSKPEVEITFNIDGTKLTDHFIVDGDELQMIDKEDGRVLYVFKKQ